MSAELTELRARLASCAMSAGSARLIQALASDMPEGVSAWVSEATVAELAERLETSPRTIRRWRAEVPDLPWLSLENSRQGYLLRLQLEGDAPASPPAKTPPTPPAPAPRRAPPSKGVTLEQAQQLLGQMASMTRALLEQYPEVLEALHEVDGEILLELAGHIAATGGHIEAIGGHTEDISRTYRGQDEDTSRPYRGHIAAIRGHIEDTGGHIAAIGGHIEDTSRPLVAKTEQDRGHIAAIGGHIEDISRPFAATSRPFAATQRTHRGHIEAIRGQNESASRDNSTHTHAPVILQRDSLRSSLLSEQGLPGARAGVPAHEGVRTHEGLACLPADKVQGLEGWIQERLAERLERYVQRPTLVEADDVEDFAKQLVERLGDALVAQRYLEDRLRQIAGRPEDKRPVSWSFMVRFLLADTSDEQLVAQAQAAAQPVSASAAQPAAYVAPSRGRAKFRAPQFEEAFEAAARPAQPQTPQQERDQWREVLKSEMAMPRHYQQLEVVEMLVERLGDEGVAILRAAVRLEDDDRFDHLLGHDGLRDELVEQEARVEPPEEAEALLDQPAEPEAPDEVQEAPSVLDLQASAAAAPSETAKTSGSYAPFPFAQLSQELGYNRSVAQRPEPCLDVVKLWPSLLDAVRAHGPRGHSVAQLLDEAKTLELDVEVQQLRVGLEDEAFVAHLMSFDMLPYRVALLERLELRTTKPGWRLIAHLAQSQEEAG